VELTEACLHRLLPLAQAAGALNPIQKVDLKGWMFKKGARKTDGFKKRWFELRGSQLAYFVGPGKASQSVATLLSARASFRACASVRGSYRLQLREWLTCQPDAGGAFKGAIELSHQECQQIGPSKAPGASQYEIEIVFVNRTYRLECPTSDARRAWILGLQDARQRPQHRSIFGDEAPPAGATADSDVSLSDHSSYFGDGSGAKSKFKSAVGATMAVNRIAGSGAAVPWTRPDFDGWLVKQGNVRTNWKRRWFELRGSVLTYSVQAAGEIKGRVDLRDPAVQQVPTPDACDSSLAARTQPPSSAKSPAHLRRRRRRRRRGSQVRISENAESGRFEVRRCAPLLVEHAADLTGIFLCDALFLLFSKLRRRHGLAQLEIVCVERTFRLACESAEERREWLQELHRARAGEPKARDPNDPGAGLGGGGAFLAGGGGTLDGANRVGGGPGGAAEEPSRMPDWAGWMLKKGARRGAKAWKKRWFELWGSRLQYFTAEGGESRGEILLNSAECEQIRVSQNKDAQANEVEIVTAGRNYRLVCEDKEQRRLWIEEMHRARSGIKKCVFL
jgi:hypothetical protein